MMEISNRMFSVRHKGVDGRIVNTELFSDEEFKIRLPLHHQIVEKTPDMEKITVQFAQRVVEYVVVSAIRCSICGKPMLQYPRSSDWDCTACNAVIKIGGK